MRHFRILIVFRLLRRSWVCRTSRWSPLATRSQNEARISAKNRQTATGKDEGREGETGQAASEGASARTEEATAQGGASTLFPKLCLLTDRQCYRLDIHVINPLVDFFQIYALNAVMTEFENNNFIEFCRKNGIPIPDMFRVAAAANEPWSCSGLRHQVVFPSHLNHFNAGFGQPTDETVSQWCNTSYTTMILMKIQYLHKQANFLYVQVSF